MLDGERLHLFTVKGPGAGQDHSEIDSHLTVRVPVKAGPHMVGVTFVRRNYAESDEPLQPHERDHDLQNMNGLPLIDHVTVTGPFGGRSVSNLPRSGTIAISCASRG